MAIASNVVFYLACSMLTGGLVMLAIPPGQRPPVQLPIWWLPGAVLLLLFCSFVPLVELAHYAAQETGTHFGAALQNVIFHFEHGQIWMLEAGAFLFLFLFLLIANVGHNPASAKIALVWTLVPIILTGWSGHATSLAPFGGFLAHTLHFLAVCVWTGILCTVGWMSRAQTNWTAFLRWYTPLSIGCVVTVTAAGLVMMHYTVPDYPVSLDGLYTKTLLLKHVLFLPVLGLGFVNGFVIPRRLHTYAEFNVLRWVRIESILVLAVFIITAFLSESPLPV